MPRLLNLRSVVVPGVCASLWGVFLLAPGPARAAGSPPIPGQESGDLAERAFVAGTAASSRVFVSPDHGDGPQEGGNAQATRVSKRAFLLGAGMVASAIVVAAWLLRPPAPCRERLQLRWHTQSWQSLREHLADPAGVPFPPPPLRPVVTPAADGCFFAE